MTSEWVQDEAQWEGVKMVIRRLYLEEGMVLKNLAETMRIEYNFRATADMYKRRLAKWGFQKHLRRRDALAMVRGTRAKAAAASNQKSLRECDGVFNPTNVERYLRRKYRSEGEILTALEEVNPPADGTRQPSPPAIPQSPIYPAGSILPLEILVSVKEYFEASFDNTTWIKSSADVDCYSVKIHGGDMSRLKSLFTYHDLACELLDAGQPAEAGLILQKASSSMKEVIAAEHPRMLSALFDLVIHLIRRRRAEVAMILLNQFSRLAIIILGKRHPVGRVCTRLLASKSIEFQQYLVLAWQSVVDRFEDHLGPLHYSTIRCRLEYIQMAIGLDNLVLAERQIRQLADRCESELGPSDLRTLKMFETLAEVMYDLGLAQECAGIGQKTVNAAETFQPQDHDRFVDLKCSGLFTIARSQQAQQLTSLAASNLWQAIDLCTSYRGLQHPLAMKYVVCLEGWARECGDLVLLDAIQEWKTAFFVRPEHLGTG